MKNLKLWMTGLLASVAVLTGCGGPGSVSGTVSGVSLAVQDAIFFIAKDDAGKSQAAVVLLADKPNLCDTFKANRKPKSVTGLMFLLMNVKVEGTAVTALAPDVADYAIVDFSTIKTSGHFGDGAFVKNDANCTDSLASTATGLKSGLVKLTSLKSEASGSAAGTFDVSVGTQADKLTGSFNASYCDLSKLPSNPSCE